MKPETITIIGFIINIVISTTVLITFVTSRKGEYKERIKHEVLLENAIKELQRMVQDILKKMEAHQTRLELLTQDLNLLLQQHRANHGQDIRRGT